MSLLYGYGYALFKTEIYFETRKMTPWVAVSAIHEITYHIIENCSNNLTITLLIIQLI